MKKVYTYLLMLSMTLLVVLNSTGAFAGDTDKRFNLFPVPAISYVQLQFISDAKDVDKVEIMNLVGKVVAEQPYYETTQYRIDLTNVPKGIYMITAKDKNGKVLQTSKLIISK